MYHCSILHFTFLPRLVRTYQSRSYNIATDCIGAGVRLGGDKVKGHQFGSGNSVSKPISMHSPLYDKYVALIIIRYIYLVLGIGRNHIPSPGYMEGIH